MLDLVARLRQMLTGFQSRPPTFGWLLRMDEQMRRIYGDRAWIPKTFAAELTALAEAGDEIGLHTHLYRWQEERSRWVTDTSDPVWMRGCVEATLVAFREHFGRPCRVHSFGDRWISEAALDVLERGGVHLELTAEPGLTGARVYREDERLLGELPDYSQAPRRLWRPAHGDFLRDDPARGRELRMLPVATYRFPAYFEPGRRISQFLGRLGGQAPSHDDTTQRHVRVCLAQKPYVVRRACALLLAEHAPPTLHFVLRSSQANNDAACRHVENNLRWLGQGGLGCDVEFSSPLRLLEGGPSPS